MLKIIVPSFKKFLNISKNKYFLASFIFLLLVCLINLGFNLYYVDKIFPGIEVLGIGLGGRTITDASSYLSQKITVPEKIVFESNQKVFELSLKELALFYDFDKTINQAFSIYRKGTWSENALARITSPFQHKVLTLSYVIDQQKLDEYLKVVSDQVVAEPNYPEVKVENGIVTINKGTLGEVLDTVTLKSTLGDKISSADFSEISLPFNKVDPTISDTEASEVKKRAEKLLGKTFILTSDFDQLEYNQETLLSFLDAREGFSRKNIDKFIDNELVPKIERPSQNANFRYENGKVIEFIPAKDGLSIEKAALENEIIENLNLLENSNQKSFSFQIPVNRTLPEITLVDVNNLGIKELLGRGTSRFRGSIPGRVHNISLASSKFNGSLISPGEIFSFNKTLGDVSFFTGYKQAYIIKDGRTVLGDGGGVCQVSTTLFRAILNAGLPIVERKAHSYRVSYYEQDSGPGLDATVFDPTSDLKFTNDTPGHLLVQTQFDAASSSLIFEIYGTSDGRVAQISQPVVASSIAPPEDLYVDDPALPTGTTKQIDYKAWGAKVVFDYSVERNGEKIMKKTFVSNYRPWQAVFLRGTGPVN